MNDVIECLRNKDDKAAYEYAKQIGMESAKSNKYLERIGDHATNIAEWVLYSLDDKRD